MPNPLETLSVAAVPGEKSILPLAGEPAPQRIVSCYPKLQSRREKHFWIRFPIGDIFSRNDCLKPMSCPKHLKNNFDVGPRSR